MDADLIWASFRSHASIWLVVSAFAIYFILTLLRWVSVEAEFPLAQTYMKFGPRWFSGHRWATSARDVMREAHGTVRIKSNFPLYPKCSSIGLY